MEGRGGGIEEEEGCRWTPHKLAGEFFFLPTTLQLQQQTKNKMEKSLCTLAAVIFLGVFSAGAGALINDATTESYSLFNNTATTATVKWTQPVTADQDQSTERQPPTTAETKLSTTTVRDEQLDTKRTKQDSEEENNSKKEEDDKKKKDEKTELGKKKSELLPSGPLFTFYVKLWETRET